MYIHTVHVCVCMCLYARTRIYMCMHTCMHICMMYVYKCICGYTLNVPTAYIHTCCIRKYVSRCTSVHVRMYACFHMYMSIYLHICIPSMGYAHPVHIYIYRHTCLNMYTYMSAYIQTHVYVHVYIYVSTHRRSHIAMRIHIHIHVHAHTLTHSVTQKCQSPWTSGGLLPRDGYSNQHRRKHAHTRTRT